jgi:voltage-gated potassium channel Kch
VAIATSKFLFPAIFGFAAKSQELLFIMAVSVSFIFSILFYYIGFSIAIGAFVAGVSLANLPYNIEIIGKVKSLRDFFAVIFFASLGMELLLGSFKTMLKPLLVFIILAIFLKPLITMFLCSFFGYKKRTAFLTSVSLAQISEFSLIIVAQGLFLGHLSQEIFSLTVIIAVVTIVLTSYFIQYEEKFYLRLAGILDIFDKLTGTCGELEYMPRKKHEVILCGYNRIGYSIVNTLKRLKKKLLVVDFNPEIIRKLINKKIPCIYGDIGDVEVLERLNLKEAQMVISTVPTKRDNLLLIKKTKEQNKKALVFVTSSQVEDALKLYDAGADYVILPHFLGGEHVSLLIEDFTVDIKKIIETKVNHIKELKKRRALGHEHPPHHPHKLY